MKDNVEVQVTKKKKKDVTDFMIILIYHLKIMSIGIEDR